MNKQMNRGLVGLATLALVMSVQGCGGGDEDTTSTASQIVVNTPATIAQVSSDNYDQNVNGLITESTLKRWKDGWATERAKLGLTGKLVILQATVGPAGAEYIRPNGTDVFTYLSPGSEWSQTRTNGVIETRSMVPDGAAMDALLKKYNIDPTKDMIVAAMGTGSTGNAMAQGRIWYALRYWGVDKKNLAILNGGNQWLDDNLGLPVELLPADFQATASVAPDNGIFSVKKLLVDNTQLQATLDDMMRILPASDTNVLNDGVFVWDARNLPQYSGTGFQNDNSRAGHPNGALLLEFSNLLDGTKGWGYKTKAELQSYLDGNVSGAGFVAGDGAGGFTAVGTGKAYQPGDTVYTYCETTFRAMITGIASGVILGLPTRYYDGAMVEWNSLSYIADRNGNYILPSDSPWRTEAVSFFKQQLNPALIEPRVITNPYAANANAIVNADKGYKTGESVSSGGGGGGSAPANPCGG